MKTLKIKEFIKNKSPENIDERLTQAFIEFLQRKRPSRIKYNESKDDLFFMTKLYVNLLLVEKFPLQAIYDELFDICHTNGLNALLINSLSVTPEIIDVYNNNEKYRGIVAYIKFVHFTEKTEIYT